MQPCSFSQKMLSSSLLLGSCFCRSYTKWGGAGDTPPPFVGLPSPFWPEPSIEQLMGEAWCTPTLRGWGGLGGALGWSLHLLELGCSFLHWTHLVG